MKKTDESEPRGSPDVNFSTPLTLGNAQTLGLFSTRPAMKAFTIKQPWVHAILREGKDNENRTWQTSYRRWLALHASAQPRGDARSPRGLLDPRPRHARLLRRMRNRSRCGHRSQEPPEVVLPTRRRFHQFRLGARRRDRPQDAHYVPELAGLREHFLDDLVRLNANST